MNNPTDIVKEYYAAFSRRDGERMLSLLQPDFTFKGPLMTFDSAEEMISEMKQCPIMSNIEAECVMMKSVTQDNQVVAQVEFRVKKPVAKTIPMTEWFMVENGRIKSAELFFDTKLFEEVASHVMAGASA